MTDLTDKLSLLLTRIHSQREEILTAFIAKYGCEPEECEQVVICSHDSTIKWFVRKRPSKEDEKDED